MRNKENGSFSVSAVKCRDFDILNELTGMIFLPHAYIVKTILLGDFPLKDYIEERAVEIASYIIETKSTVRQTAKKFGISKSTVHKDVTERLVQLNPTLASQARVVLDVNKQERHIRGGMATREKYLHQHG